MLEVTAYEVYHPELVVIKLATLDYFALAPNQLTPALENQVTIALRHISRLELIPAAAQGQPVSGNGS